MCLADAQVSERLNRRKAGIRKYMLPNAQSLVRSKSASAGEIGAWVSTDFLRRYLECRADPELDSLLDSLSPVLKNSSFLCEHKCLSPKVARTGKLLPTPLYNSLISLLRGERASLCQEFDEVEIEKFEIEECKITPTSNLICQECSTTHRDQLVEKLELLRAAKDLNDALDTKTADAAVDFKEGDEPKSDEEMNVYVLSRQTATKFRRCVAAVMKSVSKCEGGGKLENTLSMNQTSIYEGLGAIDISFLAQNTLPVNGSDKLAATKPSSNSDVLDKFFNTNITCKYEMHSMKYVLQESLIPAQAPTATVIPCTTGAKFATLPKECGTW
jgi:hypothetical protein